MNFEYDYILLMSIFVKVKILKIAHQICGVVMKFGWIHEQ